MPYPIHPLAKVQSTPLLVAKQGAAGSPGQLTVARAAPASDGTGTPSCARSPGRNPAMFCGAYGVWARTALHRNRLAQQQ